MTEPQDWDLEDQLRKALGSPAKADFQAWRNRHSDALAYLNPVVTKLYLRKRKTLMRIASVTVAAAMVVAVFCSLFFNQQPSFAQTVKAINKAETLTWTLTTYMRYYSKDGNRTWLRAQPRIEIAYRAPHSYRDTRYDRDGKVRSVEIVDTRQNKTLHLNMKSKKAAWKNRSTNQYGPGNPLGWVATILKNKPVELVGQTNVKGVKVNVFRHQPERSPTRRSVDIWLDAKTKRLVGFSEPGADAFDPTTAADRDNPSEKTFSKAQLVGSMGGDVVFNAELDEELFRLTPPKGFEVTQEPAQPRVTEAEMIAWLDATARFNDGVFFDTSRGFDHQRYNDAARKNRSDRTLAEQKLIELQTKHMRNGNGDPMLDFLDDFAADGSFRYLGKGVELGDSDRIVCWYKLKSSGAYRAVYGDLTVKDVEPKDLPLPVE